MLNKPLFAFILTSLSQFKYMANYPPPHDNVRKLLTTTLPIEININVSGLRGSQTSYLHSFSLKSPSTQTSSYHQFYSFIMEKSSNHQLLNGKISISSFPKFSISTAFKAQIHQIITKFKPNLQSTGNPKPPLTKRVSHFPVYIRICRVAQNT